jgi:hypothetical protein
MSKTYVLKSENLTHLGGPMGTEYTYDNWMKYFSDPDKAKAYAEKDYQKETSSKKTLRWLKEGKGFRTEDLLFVMYHVHPVEIED